MAVENRRDRALAVDNEPEMSVPDAWIPRGTPGRARYDAERVVAQFSVQLREQVDLDVLGGDLLGVVHRVLAPEHLALWLNDPAEPA